MLILQLQRVFGVAKHGSVWISNDNFSIRVLPFRTNDFVIILNKEKICSNLHEAYKLIEERNRPFGLFIFVTSETVDIKQCLVFGAQGAMSLTVIRLVSN